MTATPSMRTRPYLVVTAKHDAAAHGGAHLFDEAKHPRDKHGRFISIGAHLDLGDGVTGEVVSASKNVVTIKKDGGGYTAVHGAALKKATVTDSPDPSKPSVHARGVSAPAPKAAPGDANALLREGLPGFGDYLAWQRIDTGEPEHVKQARMDAAKVAKFQTVADLAERMADLPDTDLLGEADAKLIERVADGTSVYLRKPRMYAKGGLKEGPIPGTFDYIEMDKQRFDSMVKEHGPPSGIEQVDIQGFRDEKRRDAIQNMIDIWSTTSNDGDARALGLQEVAKDIFGLDGTVDWPPATMDEYLRSEIDDILKTRRTRYEAFLRAQHAATQDLFAKAGITEVPVYRGMHVPASKSPGWIESGQVPLRPLSSFSLDRATAATFGYVGPESRLTTGHLMTGTIPVSRILSTPRTGLGALEEGEVVVLGGTTTWDIARITPDDMPISQITTRAEMAAAISTASTPVRQAALAARARHFGYLDLIPGDWNTKAARTPNIDTWPNDHNEDWIKSLSWDVRTPSGDPLDTLVEFARVTGKNLKAAAKRVLSGPSAKVAPPNLIAEAHAALNGEEFPPEPWPKEIGEPGRKGVGTDTLRAMGAGRPRPTLVVEGKTVHQFDAAKHPRDDHGRWAHVPGTGMRVKIPKGYHVGARVEVHLPDFKAPGQPYVWHPATVENVTAHESGRMLDVQVRMDDGHPHVQRIGVRGGNNRIRPVSGSAHDATPNPAAREKAGTEVVRFGNVQKGDRLRHRPGTAAWHTTDSRPGNWETVDEGVVASITPRQVQGSRSGARNSSVYAVTFEDGRVVVMSSQQSAERIPPGAGGRDPQTGSLSRLPEKGRKDGTGTVDDPIEVGDDLVRAAQLLGEGKHVRLSQPEQVATLLDKLREVVADARAKGERAPNYDLCMVSVPGTNLFCKQSKGIPRVKMPQLAGEIVPGSLAENHRRPNGKADIAQPFRDALAAMGIPTRKRSMSASHLRASQAELDGVKVAGMAARMEAGGFDKGGPTVFVTRDGYILDGHHRWAARVALDTSNPGGDVLLDVEEIDLDVGAAIDYANAFSRVMGIVPKSVGGEGKVRLLHVPEGKVRPRPYLVVNGTLTAMQTAHDVLARVVEGKSAQGKFEEAKHPRDGHGRFISIGAHLDLGGGKGGEVTHVSKGVVTVRQSDGKNVTVKGDALKRATVSGGDGSAPHAPSAGGRSGGGGAPGGAPATPGSRPSSPSPDHPARPAPQKGDGSVPAATPHGDAPAAGIPKPLTDMQYEQHTAQIEAATTAALKNGQSTDVLYSLDGKGQVWNPDRAKQHKEIVDALWAKADAVPSDGKALIAGGLGGAGKGTVLGKYANIPKGDYLTVNPDDVKELMVERGMVPKVPGLSPMEASTLIHEESSHVANMLAQRAYAERKNMIWDITMSSKGSVARRIQEMRGAGYGHIEALFVDIPVETSVQRALGRHRRGMEQHRAGQGPGGRYVPPSIIRKNADAKWSSANRGVFENLKGEFDAWQVWDTSAPGMAPKKVATSGKSGNFAAPQTAAAQQADAMRVSGGVTPAPAARPQV